MDLRSDPPQTNITNIGDKRGMSIARTDKKHADINKFYRDLAIKARDLASAAKAQEGCKDADKDNIDLITNSMAELTLMQGGGVRQTGGQLIDSMVPMLLLFSGDVNAFFQRAGRNVDAIINWFARWWSELSNCVKDFWGSIFGTDEHAAAAAALLRFGGNEPPEREQLTWNYIMEMIGSATTSAMEKAAAAGTAAGKEASTMSASAKESAQPYIAKAKENPVQFGAGIAALGSNIYLFGDTVADGAMWLLTLLQGVSFTHWMVATSIIASYLAIRGTGNIDVDKATLLANKNNLFKKIMAAPADVIVAAHTTPAQIEAMQTNFKTYFMKAQTRGMLKAQEIKQDAKKKQELAQIREAEVKQRKDTDISASLRADSAQKTIGRMVRARQEAKKLAELNRNAKLSRATTVAKRRNQSAAGFGTAFTPGASAGARPKGGGKRNTKKRSNKKKKTKKHKKKQHRKTKRG
jgi:hypothetical protein